MPNAECKLRIFPFQDVLKSIQWYIDDGFPDSYYAEEYGRKGGPNKTLEDIDRPIKSLGLNMDDLITKIRCNLEPERSLTQEETKEAFSSCISEPLPEAFRDLDPREIESKRQKMREASAKRYFGMLHQALYDGMLDVFANCECAKRKT